MRLSCSLLLCLVAGGLAIPTDRRGLPPDPNTAPGMSLLNEGEATKPESRYAIRVHTDLQVDGNCFPRLYVGRMYAGEFFSSFVHGPRFRMADSSRARQMFGPHRFPSWQISDIAIILNEVRKHVRDIFLSQKMGDEIAVFSVLTCNVRSQTYKKIMATGHSLLYSTHGNYSTRRPAIADSASMQTSHWLCRKLGDVFTWSVVGGTPQLPIAPVLSTQTKPAVDGRVLVSCTATGFYPPENNMYFQTPGGFNPMVNWGGFPQNTGNGELYDRTIYLFVPKENLNRTTCSFKHSSKLETSVMTFDLNVEPLCPHNETGWYFHHEQLVEFIVSEGRRQANCSTQIQFFIQNNDAGPGVEPVPTLGRHVNFHSEAPDVEYEY